MSDSIKDTTQADIRIARLQAEVNDLKNNLYSLTKKVETLLRNSNKNNSTT